MALRILFATTYLHVPQGNGGGERNTHELCLALQRLGDVPAVSCHLQVDGSPLFWVSRLRRILPRRREYSCDNGLGYPVYRGWDQSRVAEAVQRHKPDVIVVQGTHPEPLIDALMPTGVPLVAYFHEVEEVEHLRFLQGTGIPVLANSEFTANRLAETCGLHCEVVLPLIDPKHYITSARPEQVLYVNTHQRKGVAVAFAVAERRLDIPFTFVLTWVHSQAEFAELRQRAAAAGNITLHPPTQDMRPLYARTKILLAPSQWEETWGRVATEAHVNGIPVIGSNRGGLPQAIGPGGIIVPYRAPTEEWVAALSRLWDDPNAYAAASEAARAYAARPEIQPMTIAAKLHAILQRTATAPSLKVA